MLSKGLLKPVLLCSAVATLATRLPAQDENLPRPYSTFTLVAANAGLGAVTAIIGQAIRGVRMDAKKTAQGALGGVVVYGGKAIVAENRWYSNLLGRELAAVGSSGVQNIASGRGFADRLSLPYGPARLNIDRRARTRVKLKVDLARMVTLGAALSDVHLNMQVERSLLYGVPVFRDDGPVRDEYAAGSHVGGVVTYRERTVAGIATAQEMRRTMAHELVHVIQGDFSFNTWGGPLELALMRHSELTRVVHNYFDLGLDVPLASMGNSMISYSSRPWEREAVSLAPQR